jgi:hypothetical protein
VIRRSVCALALALLPVVLHAQCSPVPERPPANNVPDYVQLIPDAGMMREGPNATATAANQWGSCAFGRRPGFPFPVLNPTWNAPTATLNVVFNTGVNLKNPTSCGSTSGNTINVFSNAYKGNVLVACSTYGYDQIIEHELGHYYGLKDIFQSGCTDIMAQLDGSQHYVTGSDCTMADSQNQTIDENNPIDYSCQQPCFTNCVAGNCPAQNGGSPIIFDIDGDGFRLSGPADPVDFDLFSDGIPVWTSWTAGGSGTAFLALDLNGNGLIDDGGELFGNHTRLMDGSFAKNGYEALAQYDEPINGGNGNGVIDPGDAVFARLLIWTDWNHDGKTDAGELQTLSEAGIVAIDLAYHADRKQDRYGNEFRFRGRALRSTGDDDTRVITTYDVFFVAGTAPVSGLQPRAGTVFRGFLTASPAAHWRLP